MKAVCRICPHHCAIENGQTGLCGARKNINGEVVSGNYGRLTAIALDPIEKKPLARFLSGSKILSVGSYGCNLRCEFCQNSSISMADATAETIFVSPEQLVRRALAAVPRGNVGLAYTYNEPLVGFEYVMDCARLAHEAGLVNVVVTNGMICEQPLSELLPHVDAMNIDLKGFSQAFYDTVGGKLDAVKQTITQAASRCHVEVTTLIIPGANDNFDEMEREAEWLSTISYELPLHISRFFPRYHMSDCLATPVETVYRLRDAARKHLKFVYAGNC